MILLRFRFRRLVIEAENIALYRRLIEDGVGIGNLDLLDEILSPDIALPTIAAFAEPTIVGLKQVNSAFRGGEPAWLSWSHSAKPVTNQLNSSTLPSRTNGLCTLYALPQKISEKNIPR